MNISMHFEGYVEAIIEEAVKQGIVGTKVGALRAGLLELNDKYGLVPALDEIEYLEDLSEIKRIEADIKSGKEKVRKVKDINSLFE